MTQTKADEMGEITIVQGFQICSKYKLGAGVCTPLYLQCCRYIDCTGNVEPSQCFNFFVFLIFIFITIRLCRKRFHFFNLLYLCICLIKTLLIQIYQMLSINNFSHDRHLYFLFLFLIYSLLNIKLSKSCRNKTFFC